MSDYFSTELAATCGALGYYDGIKYHLDTYCLDVIKDLIKYLRKDNDNHVVRQFLGQTNLLQTDLIKIFIDHSDKLELWDVLLRLIINLTSPVFLVYNEQIPTDKVQYATYQKLVAYTQDYKVALTDDRIWAALSNRLSEILRIENIERGEEKEMIIERILIFIRNVLQIPPDENEKRVDNDVTVHDEVLFALHASGVVDLLLFIASNESEQQYHMQVLEIVSLMFRDQNASQLAKSGLQRSTTEKERDEAVLLAARLKEKQEKMEKVRKYASSRHSHFGGTYVMQNLKSIGDNQLLCHKPYQNIEALNFSKDKSKASKLKNKQPITDSRGERMSTLSVRLFLKEFCVEFLNAAYNPVMKFARSCIIGANNPGPNETVCYLWAMRFFMEFNRNYKFEVKYVSETISTETFYSVQKQMDRCYEMMILDKKKIPLWSRRLHVALKAYQELLYTLMAMDQSKDRGVRESSRVIKSNVFYVQEYRETILSQLFNFDEAKMSRQYLIDLVTTAHIFLKMLGHHCGKGNRRIVVQKVKHKRHKSGNKKNQKKTAQKEQPPSQSLEERWDDISPQLSVVMREGTIPEVIPFDATLDTPIEDQKVDAMKKIQKLLRSKSLEQAVGLLRAAREVWTENDCFGKADITPEEEFLALRDIFVADLGVVEDDPVTQNETNQQENIENLLNNVSEEGEENENEEEESQSNSVAVETNFNFSEFVNRFANVKVVRALLILLRQFDKNTDEVNHYVNKMLHRISWDCKMPGMMFQASMFRVFQRILESKHPGHKELQQFAVFIIRRFVEVAQKNRKAFMELLFWKTTHDAVQVVDGYNGEKVNKKVSRSFWTEAQEDELRTLFMEHQTNNYPQDLIDWLLEHINQERTRRGIIKKLKELSLIVNSKSVRSEVQKRLPKEWSEKEIAQLTELWEQLKDDEDPVDLIFNGLTIKRPKPKIKEKLLELGLATDRKELRKKRFGKSNRGKSSWETQSVSNSEKDESSDEEGGKSSTRKKKASNKPTGKQKKAGKKNRQTMVYTDAQLSGLLKDVIEKNMNEALEWIKESLQDVLDDRDEESSEGIPLVPLTDYSSTAMDSASFQKLIRAMGFTPPVVEREPYWRLPSNILNSTIRKHCNLIDAALAGNFVVEEPRAASTAGETDSDSDDDVDVLENIRKYFKSKAIPEPSTSRQPDSEPDVDFESILSKSKVSSKSTEQINIEVEKPETGSSQTVEITEKSSTERRKSGGRAKLLIDSSDSEPEIERNVHTEVVPDEGKRNRSDSLDRENETVKKRRLLDSDEETEPLKSQDTEQKRTRMIISDDEEEPAEKKPTQQRTSRMIISDDED